ncbi:Vacuolar fusion protein CCZ1 homolog OS=Gallus gallus GN=CCZ1 PE=2 SV=1 [Rhizoctonia solani AG-1 IB]|uniref:Vacuolar fusion protein CCZ1 homolog n=1 Tax=Thanatephorus cucumeris (strain AG1-IB / isolate 7/3/14) TaxID=1108050 RepID=A0A0B7F847_THACB|nr:Vacuolar fusion protein CCZ1 homolog OS=Gallus gallus GN=CCZ1 PE=2 SV=1 [Rhizoctonia solani AG-1 IB]
MALGGQSRAHAELTINCDYEDLTDDRDEDDVAEQAHVLFYTAREQAVSRDRILRQVGLAKALANFAEMFTSQSGFDNVHAQKSRLVMISPEPNFWIHACVNLAKTPKTTTKSNAPPSSGQPDEFEYHSNSLNDEVLRTQLLHGYQSFRLQYGGFGQMIQADGVRFLEHRLESYFMHWAWQWNVGATPEFGSYLGLSIHPLKKQFTTSIADYAQQIPNTPTLVMAPPHIVTGPGLLPISPLLPLARLLEPLVPPLVPSPQRSHTVAVSAPASAPLNMLATSGNVVTKYITKPAAQVVDPRNWSWPALPFGKGSVRGKDKDRGKLSTNITVETSKESKGPSGESISSFEQSASKDHLGPPTDEATSRASRSVSPSTIDHESLLDAQLDMITSNKNDAPVDPAFIPLPIGSDSDLVTSISDLGEDSQSADRVSVTSDVPVESTLFTTTISDQTNVNKSGTSTVTNPESVDDEQAHLAGEPTSESLQATPIALARVGLPTEDPAPAPSTVAPTKVQVQSSTHTKIETTSGVVNVWLDSPGERVGLDGIRKQRVTWIAIPGLLVASVIGEEEDSIWRDAAQRLLQAIHETIQKRQLTAAETTLRALNTTKIVAHYPTAQLSGSSSLPQFTSESPYLFTSARALQFATSPAIREIVTQTRWGTWCAARQSTIKTRVYIEVDRKDANLVEVDHELGSACRRWEESDV